MSDEQGSDEQGMTVCVCGQPEGENADCERCEILRMGNTLTQVVIRFGDRLVELGDDPMLTVEELAAMFRQPIECVESAIKSHGLSPKDG